MITNLNCLGSVCEEVQYPVAECVNEAQSAKFNKQHSDVVVVIFKVCEH